MVNCDGKSLGWGDSRWYDTWSIYRDGICARWVWYKERIQDSIHDMYRILTRYDTRYVHDIYRNTMGTWSCEIWEIGIMINDGSVHVVHKVPISRFSPRYLSKALEFPSFHHWKDIPSFLIFLDCKMIIVLFHLFI